jgi:hypothetical protein
MTNQIDNWSCLNRLLAEIQKRRAKSTMVSLDDCLSLILKCGPELMKWCRFTKSKSGHHVSNKKHDSQ